MPKGIFTQGICILLERVVSLDAVAAELDEFKVLGQREASESWAFGGPSLVVDYLAESNGLVAIDVVDQRWPDHMGDPKEDMMVFGAWTMGHFGPFAYPGGLQRAGEQSWSWEPGRTIAQQHTAFLRIRSSFALGAEDDEPVIPEDYQALPELEFATNIATALLNVRGALCYFNPNGEVLRDQDGLRESLNYGWAHKLPPLDVWSNVRLFNFNDEWSLMDTVGNGQLDVPDVEACFHSEHYDFQEVDNFLRNVSLYLLNHGEIVNDGDTMDGPGQTVWHAQNCNDGVCDPPRHVLRWLPRDNRPVPPEVLNAGRGDER